MYEHYFGLREKPFSVFPDPDFLYMSSQHSTALAMLEYGLMNESGYIVITGEIGCGKTTLVRRLLEHHEEDSSVGLISNTNRSQDSILERVLLAFGLEFEDSSHTKLYSRLVDFLIHEYAKLRNCVLVVDEAQNLSVDSLEELRTLSNINADKAQLIQLILLGQPELVDTLGRPDFRQFAQRIAMHYHLDPLNDAHTRRYIRHRLQAAGGTATLFTDDACLAVYRETGGVPRLINRLCDTALLYAYGDSYTQIDAKLVTKAAHEISKGGLTGLSKMPTGIMQNIATPASEGAYEPVRPELQREQAPRTIDDGTDSSIQSGTPPSKRGTHHHQARVQHLRPEADGHLGRARAVSTPHAIPETSRAEPARNEEKAQQPTAPREEPNTTPPASDEGMTEGNQNTRAAKEPTSDTPPDTKLDQRQNRWIRGSLLCFVLATFAFVLYEHGHVERLAEHLADASATIIGQAENTRDDDIPNLKR